MKLRKAPQRSNLVFDVVRDLRDRHLLLPVAALVVALVVIPMMLKSSAETVPAVAPVPPGSAAASPVSAAVMAEDQTSVRNYQKRLEDLKSTNPFKQQFTAPIGGGDEAAADDGTAAAGTGAATAPVDAGVGSSGVASGGSTEVIDEGDAEIDDEPVETDPAPDDDTETAPSEPKPADVETVTSLVTRRVNLRIGAGGTSLSVTNVKPMTMLPDETTPVAAFLGTDEAGKRAAFVVAKDATVAGGTATCVPAPENCLYVTLKVGDEASFQLADGQQFELRLMKILDVEL